PTLAPSLHDALPIYWFVWQLIDGPFPNCSPQNLVRSTCQAGYKAMWNSHSGYPSEAYFAAVHRKMRTVVTEKMPGTLLSPGRQRSEEHTSDSSHVKS